MHQIISIVWHRSSDDADALVRDDIGGKYRQLQYRANYCSKLAKTQMVYSIYMQTLYLRLACRLSSTYLEISNVFDICRLLEVQDSPRAQSLPQRHQPRYHRRWQSSVPRRSGSSRPMKGLAACVITTQMDCKLTSALKSSSGYPSVALMLKTEFG